MKAGKNVQVNDENIEDKIGQNKSSSHRMKQNEVRWEVKIILDRIRSDGVT